MVQWLRICVSTAGGTGSIPGWGTKILACYMVQLKRKKTWCMTKANTEFYSCSVQSFLLKKLIFCVQRSKGDITLGAEEITHSRLHFPVCEVCLESRGSFEILKMGIASTPWSLPQRLAFFRLASCFEPDSMSITGTSPLFIII